MDAMANQYRDVIKDGTYYITSSKNTSFVLDVDGGSKDDFGNIQLYQYNGTLAQGWKINHDSQGYVTFINVGSNRAIDLFKGNATNWQNVNQYTSNDTFAQKWIVSKEGNGFKIMSAIDINFVLDVASGKVQNSANIQVYKSNDTAAQRWYFNAYESPRQKLDKMVKQYNSEIEEATYVISYFANPSYSIDVSMGSKENYANVWLYNSNNTDAQKWTVKKDSDGYITFINVGSNMALDVQKAVAKSGTNIWQFQYNDTYAQKWVAKKNTDGSLTFVSALDPNYVLDISNGKVVNSQNIQLYQSNGTNAQKFKLTRV